MCVSIKINTCAGRKEERVRWKSERTKEGKKRERERGKEKKWNERFLVARRLKWECINVVITTNRKYNNFRQKAGRQNHTLGLDRCTLRCNFISDPDEKQSGDKLYIYIYVCIFIVLSNERSVKNCRTPSIEWAAPIFNQTIRLIVFETRRSFSIVIIFLCDDVTMFLCFFDFNVCVWMYTEIRSNSFRKFKGNSKYKRIFPPFLFDKGRREGRGREITMNGIISSMNPYIVLSCLRYLFPSKRLNLKKKEIKKKQREIAIGEQKSKMNFRFVSFRFERKKKKKGRNWKTKTD